MIDLAHDILVKFVRAHVDDPTEALELQQALRALLIESQNFAPFEEVSAAHKADISAFVRRWGLEGSQEYDRIKDLVLNVMSRADRVTLYRDLVTTSLIARPNVLPLPRPAIPADHAQATG